MGYLGEDALGIGAPSKCSLFYCYSGWRTIWLADDTSRLDSTLSRGIIKYLTHSSVHSKWGGLLELSCGKEGRAMGGDVSAQLVVLCRTSGPGLGVSGKEAVSTRRLVNSRKSEGKLCLNESQRHRVLKWAGEGFLPSFRLCCCEGSSRLGHPSLSFPWHLQMHERTWSHSQCCRCSHPSQRCLCCPWHFLSSLGRRNRTLVLLGYRPWWWQIQLQLRRRRKQKQIPDYLK